MEKSRHGAFVYAQKVLKHSLFLFLLTHQFIKYFAGYFGINNSFRAKVHVEFIF